MNRKTAKKVSSLIDRISEINGQLREIADDLQEKYEALSEDWQEGEKGQTLADEIGKIEELCDALDYADAARPEE